MAVSSDPSWQYVQVSSVAQVVDLAGRGVIPPDGTFTPLNDEVSVTVSWFGFPAADGKPARVWKMRNGEEVRE